MHHAVGRGVLLQHYERDLNAVLLAEIAACGVAHARDGAYHEAAVGGHGLHLVHGERFGEDPADAGLLVPVCQHCDLALDAFLVVRHRRYIVVRRVRRVYAVDVVHRRIDPPIDDLLRRASRRDHDLGAVLKVGPRPLLLETRHQGPIGHQAVLIDGYPVRPQSPPDDYRVRIILSSEPHVPSPMHQCTASASSSKAYLPSGTRRDSPT